MAIERPTATEREAALADADDMELALDTLGKIQIAVTNGDALGYLLTYRHLIREKLLAQSAIARSSTWWQEAIQQVRINLDAGGRSASNHDFLHEHGAALLDKVEETLEAFFARSITEQSNAAPQGGLANAGDHDSGGSDDASVMGAAPASAAPSKEGRTTIPKDYADCARIYLSKKGWKNAHGYSDTDAIKRLLLHAVSDHQELKEIFDAEEMADVDATVAPQALQPNAARTTETKRGDFWKRCWENSMVPSGWRLVPEKPTEQMLFALYLGSGVIGEGMHPTVYDELTQRYEEMLRRSTLQSPGTSESAASAAPSETQRTDEAWRGELQGIRLGKK